jgi:NADH-ubiquinone oxidoreductase chain 6
MLTNINALLLSPTGSDASSITTVFNAFNPAIADTTFTNFLQVQAIGHGLYTYGAIFLIITSVILLLAMIAPIFISRPSQYNHL